MGEGPLLIQQEQTMSEHFPTVRGIVVLEDILLDCLEKILCEFISLPGCPDMPFDNERTKSIGPDNIVVPYEWIRASVCSGAVKSGLKWTQALTARLLRLLEAADHQLSERITLHRSFRLIQDWKFILAMLYRSSGRIPEFGSSMDPGIDLPAAAAAICVVRRATDGCMPLRDEELKKTDRNMNQQSHELSGINPASLSFYLDTIGNLSEALNFETSDIGQDSGTASIHRINSSFGLGSDQHHVKARGQVLVLAACVPKACRNSFCWNLECGTRQSLPSSAGSMTDSYTTTDEVRAQIALETGRRRHQRPLGQSCAKCLVTAYCSKECQREAWIRGGHREECRVIGEMCRQ